MITKKKTTVLKLPLILPSSSKPFQFRKRKEVWFFCPPLQAGCSAIPLAVSLKSHPLGDPLGQHPVCRDESRHNSILSGSSSASALLVLLLQVCVSWRTKTRKYISCAAGSFCSSVSSWQDRTGNVHFLGCTQCEVEEVFRDAFFFSFWKSHADMTRADGHRLLFSVTSPALHQLLSNWLFLFIVPKSHANNEFSFTRLHTKMEIIFTLIKPSIECTRRRRGNSRRLIYLANSHKASRFPQIKKNTVCNCCTNTMKMQISSRKISARVRLSHQKT